MIVAVVVVLHEFPQSVGGPRAGESGGGSSGSPWWVRILLARFKESLERKRRPGTAPRECSRLWKYSQEQVEDSGEQLLLYSHLASEIAPGKKVATRFLVLTKTKEPVVEEHVREVEPAAVKRTLAGVERVWRALESGVFYPAPSTMSCSSCGYRAACRAWMG